MFHYTAKGYHESSIGAIQEMGLQMLKWSEQPGLYRT